MNEHVPYYRLLLQEELEKRVSKNNRYSLRSFANALGIDPGTLSRILAGKRALSFKTAITLIQNLSLDYNSKLGVINSMIEENSKKKSEQIPE